METQTSTTGITFKVDADVLAESAEATAEAVVKAKHDLDKVIMLKYGKKIKILEVL